MHKATLSGGTPTSQNASPFFFSTLFSGGLLDVSPSSIPTTTTATTTTASRSRPGTSAGELQSSLQSLSSQQPPPPLPPSIPLPPPPPLPPGGDRLRPNVLTKERRPSLSKKPSFTRRRGSSSNGSGGAGVGFLFQQPHHQHHQSSNSVGGSVSSINSPYTDGNATARPPLPSDWLAAAAAGRIDSPNPDIVVANYDTASPTLTTATAATNFSHRRQPSAKMITATLVGAGNPGLGISLNGAGTVMNPNMSSELTLLHQHMQEMANKRISTLDYLRKAHEGRVYWFNTLRFDRPDLARMPYFDPRRLARRATNYLLLGLSIPAVVDLNSASALELLRSLNTLLAEFDAFQQLHAESGSGGTASSLSRAARLPQMFRRATPGSKVRRTSSSAASGSNDFGAAGGSFDGGAVGGGAAGGAAAGAGLGGGMPMGSGGVASVDSIGGSALTLVNSESGASVGGTTLGSGGGGGGGSVGVGGASGSAAAAASTAFATHYDNNADLLPGEEYTLLLTPSLPFDPDFFETFATLCDVLIDCYTRILSLVPTPRDCSALVAELFTKADARVRKLLVQGVVKEFEDNSRAGVKMEVANVGKVVLGGLL